MPAAARWDLSSPLRRFSCDRPGWSRRRSRPLEEFVLGGGSLLLLHNSMWGYPVKPHTPAIAADVLLQELRDVQAVLSASSRPTISDDVGLGDVGEMRPFRRLCGAVGGYHPAFERVKYTVVEPSHPIVQGVSVEFSMHDEQHFTVVDEHRGAKLFLAPGHVPLGGRRQGLELPEGEVDSLRHPMTQRLLHNAVNWLVDPGRAAKL